MALFKFKCPECGFKQRLLLPNRPLGEFPCPNHEDLVMMETDNGINSLVVDRIDNGIMNKIVERPRDILDIKKDHSAKDGTAEKAPNELV